MSDELHLIRPPRVIDLHQQQLLIQADQVAQADAQMATPGAEEIRTADRLFAQEHKKDDGLTAFLGVATGMIVLHDMAVDRFANDEEEEEVPEPKEKPDDE